MSSNHEHSEAMGREEVAGVISEKTKVPLGVAITLLGACVGGMFWMTNQLSEIKREFVAVKYELNDIKRELAARQNKEAFERWIIQFRADNPGVKVPALNYAR